jgi:predicted hotdog family 3-hydroxylacyl-ACP dehydratase
MNTDITSDELRPMIGKPAETFVLHRAPMLFLDRLVDISEDSATCEWNISDDFELLVPGCGIPAYTGVEFMAQCVAVHAGARARAQGLVPPHGYLLGTRHFKSCVEWFEPGITYHSTCQELVRDLQGMGSFACRILLRGDTIAEANLAVLERPQEITLDE